MVYDSLAKANIAARLFFYHERLGIPHDDDDFQAFLRTRHISIMEQNVDSSAEAYHATGHDHAGQNVETVTVQEMTPFAEGKAGRGKGKRSAGTVKTPTKETFGRYAEGRCWRRHDIER